MPWPARPARAPEADDPAPVGYTSNSPRYVPRPWEVPTVSWRVASLVVLVQLSGCGVGTNCAPPNRLCKSIDGRSSRYSGAPSLERVSVECCDGETAPDGTCEGTGEWWGNLQLEGTASRAVLTVLVESPEEWTETHTIPLLDRDPYGHWEIRYTEWTIANTSSCDSYEACSDLYQSSTNSLVQCTETLARTRFVIEIYDGETTPADCVTWGAVYPRPPAGCRDAEAAGLL